MEDQNSQNTIGKEEISSNQQVNKLCEILKHNKKVNMFGPPGVGKTWMAKRVSDLATRKKFVDLTLWVFMCKEYTKESLSKSIALQLCLLPTTEEWEDGDERKEQKDNDDVVQNQEILIQKLMKKLQGKEILLILDDVHLDHKTDHDSGETKFWSLWNEMFPNENFKTLLISRLKREHEDISNVVEVKAFSREESYSLLIEKLDTQLRMNDKIQAIGKTMIERSNNLPGTVTMIAKALNYFGVDASRMTIIEKQLEETSDNYNVNKLLCMKNIMLPISVLKDLWWRGHHFFRDSASVHYNELITYWILEGFIGFGGMASLYNRGHGIVMELMDCGIIKGLEGDYVFMDNSLINVDDLYQSVDQIPNLGLATVFTSDKYGFGKITHEDGMLKTPRTRTKGKNEEIKESSKEAGQNLSTLLLDGTHFSEQVMLNFLEYEKELQVLALLNPTIKSLPKSLDMMEKLRVLVLKGCEFLQDVKLPLKALNVLEISSARSLRSLRSVFFKNMVNLQSIHLSGLQITYLPQAFYNLLGLQWLVIKDCRRLKKLESLAKLEHLIVIDLSGNIVLDTVDKNFLKFKKLQSLNLSNTLVSTTPLLKNIGELTHLLCRDCKSLGRLRGLTSLTNLQTLDLSGSTEFEEFHDSSLESLKSLKTLDLSGTAIESLPSNISNPHHLYLKSCLQLERLPCIESLVNLEVLDFSGSKNLTEFEEGFFDQITRLRVLNLSETSIVSMPSLSKLSNLRELFLSHCPSLARLPSLESAKNLEILDASCCSSLEDIGNHSFEENTRLQKLNLSETKIKYFPPLLNPCRLRYLLLKNCKALINLEVNVSLPNLEELNLSNVTFLKPNGAEFIKDMRKIKVLDLSNTSLKELPSMSKLTNLTHLSLAGCSCSNVELDLDPLSKLEVLDLSGSSIKRLRNLSGSQNLQKLMLKGCSVAETSQDVEFIDLLRPNLKIPDGMSELIQLAYIEFPNVHVATSHVESSSEEGNQNQWSICRLSEDDKPSIFTSGNKFLELLKESTLLESFHLCAIPEMVENEYGDRYLQRHELVFQDVYLQTCGFGQYKGNKSLQIRGFNHFPKGIEDIINHVNMCFLIDNNFNGFPYRFDASKLNELKGCWIDRCDDIVTIFTEKEGNENSNFEFFLECLGISNNRGLESIYNGKRSLWSFDSLRSLYLHSCPKLATVLQSSWLPKNLEVLEVKHCDKIVSIFDQDKGKLPNLKTLHLWELPELENVNISFPALKTLKIWECPKVKQFEGIFEFSKILETLWITGATSLKSLDGISSLNYLYTLILESCPMLEYVTSSLDVVKTIEIRSCEKLKILFTHLYYMQNLNTLRLENLPMLKMIGVTFPSTVKLLTYECQNLQLQDMIVD